MRDLLKKFRNGAVAGAGFIAALALVPAGYAAIATFTGVSGSNPITGTVPGVMPDLNYIINAVNTQLGNYLAFNQTGEVGQGAFTNSASWTANGAVATAMTSVGPTGSHTTVQEWLTVVDNVGTVRYVPAF